MEVILVLFKRRKLPFYFVFGFFFFTRSPFVTGVWAANVERK
jgi:hypothetical protein